MCPDLCVGTLVLDRPLTGPVRPGMVVTFSPPGTPTVYTHRVVRVLPDGSARTAGDTLGVLDPWTVPHARVIGRVVANVRGLGWLWRSLPSMAAGPGVPAPRTPLEHGRSPKKSVQRWQDRLTPIQRRVFGGCHLNRPIDDLVAASGLAVSSCKNFYMKGPRFMGFMYEGVATKS